MPERTLSKDRIARLAQCGWVEGNEVLAIISKTGGGKSYISQALGNAACRKLLPTRCARLSDLCQELNRARIAGDGSHFDLMDRCKSVKLLMLDDSHHADTDRELGRPLRAARGAGREEGDADRLPAGAG